MSKFCAKIVICTISLIFVSWVPGILSSKAQDPPELNFGDLDGYFYNCSYSDENSEFDFQLSNFTSAGDKGRITAYQVTWGDGDSENVTNGDFPLNHTYQQGIYDLIVQATYDGGSTTTVSYKVYNTKPDCSVVITSGESGCAPREYVFELLPDEDNPPITQYYWSFGDGGSVFWDPQDVIDNGNEVSHTYTRSSCLNELDKLYQAGAQAILPCGAGYVEGLASYKGPIRIYRAPDPSFNYLSGDASLDCSGCIERTAFTIENTTEWGYFGFDCDDSKNFSWEIYKMSGGVKVLADPADYSYELGSANTLEPSIVFNNVGEYYIRLNASNECNSDDPAFYDSGKITIYDINSAVYTDYSPKRYCFSNDQVVEFTSVDPEVGDLGETSYLWGVVVEDVNGVQTPGTEGVDFEYADGTNFSSRNPHFKFLHPGKFLVILNKSNTCGVSAALEFPVEVADKPTAVILDPDNINSNGNCGDYVFTPRALYADNGVESYGLSFNEIVEYQWEFSDNGVVTTSNLAEPESVTFSREGDAYVTLKVRSDNCGWSDVSRIDFEIYSVPEPSITVSDDICEDVSVDFVASPDNMKFYIWNFGDGASSQGQNVGHIYANNGEYNAKLIVISNDNCSNEVSKTLQVKRWPQANAGLDDVICNLDLTYSLSGSSASDYSSLLWSSSGDGNFDDNTLLHPVYSPGPLDVENGTVTLTLKADGIAPCGEIQDEMILTISKAPVIHLADTEGEFCQGWYYSVNGTVVENYSSLQWTSNQGGYFLNGTTENPSYTPPDDFSGIVVLTLNAMAHGGCDNKSATITLTVTPRPQHNAGVDQVICEGSTVSLSGTALNSISPDWHTDGDGAFDDPDQLNTVYTPGVADISQGGVNIWLSGGGLGSCAGNIDVMNVMIQRNPKAEAGDNSKMCASEPYYAIQSGIEPEMASAQDYGSLEWTSSGTGHFQSANQIDALYYPSQDDIDAGQVTLTLTAQAQAPCVGAMADQMLLDIIPVPLVDAGDNQTLCEGEVVILAGSASNNQSVQWSSSGDGSFDDPSLLNAKYTPAPGETGNIQFTLTANPLEPCQVVMDNLVVTYVPHPVADAGANNEVCENSVFQIPAGNEPGKANVYSADSFLWATSGDGIFDDATRIDARYTPGVNDKIAGTVILSLKAFAIAPCVGFHQDDMELTITTAPSVDAGDNTAICQRDLFAPLAIASNFSELSWTTSSGVGGYFDQVNILNPTYHPGADEVDEITLTLTVRGNGSCADISDNMQVDITPAPIANAGPDVRICEDGVYTVESASVDHNSGFSWSTTGTGMFIATETLTPTYVAAEGETGDVILTLRAQGNGSCNEVSDELIITIVPHPTVEAGDDGEVCSNEIYQLNMGDEEGEVNAKNWSSFNFTTSGDGSFSINGVNVGYILGEQDRLEDSVVITLHASGINPCLETVEDQMTLYITPEPVVDAGDDGRVCEGEVFQVEGDTVHDITGMTWSSPDGGGFDDLTVLNPLYTPQEGLTGEISLLLTGSGNGSCKPAVDTMILDIIPLPQVSAGADTLICEGKDYILLGATASSYSSVEWTTSGTGFFVDSSLLNAKYIPGAEDLQAGAVELAVRVEAVSPCILHASDRMILSFTPPPIVEAGKRDTICEETGFYQVKTKSDSYPLGADTLNISSFVWVTDGAGQLNDENTLQPLYQAADDETGMVNLILIGYGNANCDPVYDTLQLTILPTPVPDFEFGLSCVSNFVDFVDKSSGEGYELVSWSWNFDDDSTSLLQNPQHIFDSVGDFTVNLDVSNFFGCQASFQKVVEVQPLPDISFSHDTVVAINSEVSFGNNTENGNRYYWDFNDGNLSQEVEPSHAYQTAGVYDVKLNVKSLYGCVDSVLSKLEVIDVPQARFSKTKDGCAPLDVAFFDQSEGRYIDYFWDFGNGVYSTKSNPDIVVFGQGGVDTTYTVTLRVSNLAGISETSHEVTVYPNPQPDFEILPHFYGCSPVTRTIYNTSKGNSQNYKFDFGDGSIYEYDAPNVERPFEHLFETGDEKAEYTVRLTASNGCSEKSIEKTMTVFPNSAVAVFRPSSNVGCAPFTVNFQNLSVGAGDYLQSEWIFEEGMAPYREVPGEPVSYTFTEGGVYKVMLAVHDTCAFDTTYQTIVVHQPSPLGFKIDARNFCEKESMHFYIPQDTVLNFTNIEWDFGDGTVSSQTNLDHTFAEEGEYEVTLTAIDIVHGCRNIATQQITIASKPDADFEVVDSIGCEPLNVKFTNQSQGAEYYTWDFADGASSSLSNPEHTFIKGRYDVKLIVEDLSGCTDTIYKEVVSHPKPIVDFQTDSDIGCDLPFLLSVDNISENKSLNTYEWDFGNGGVSSQTDPQPQAYMEYGDYDIQLIAVNQYMCSDTAKGELTVFPKPDLSFEVNDSSICLGDEIVLRDTSLYRVNTFWNLGDVYASQGQVVNYVFPAPGQYCLKMKVVGDGGCADSVLIRDYFKVYPNPVADFASRNIDSIPEGLVLNSGIGIPKNGSVTFFNNSRVGADMDWIRDSSLYYLWDFRDNNGSEEIHPYHRYENNGRFAVKLVVTSAYGCKDSLVNDVEVDLMCSLYIPNAFAPGNANEEVARFIPKGIGLYEYRIEVYDSWGKLLWESEKIDQGRPAEYWDGYYKGELMPQGTYLWRARGVFLDGSVWQGVRVGDKYYRQGSVTLVR